MQVSVEFSTGIVLYNFINKQCFIILEKFGSIKLRDLLLIIRPSMLFLPDYTVLLPVQLKEDEKTSVSEFFKNCYYVQGPYNEESGFKKLNAELDKLGKGKDVVNRLFYLALPPSVFMDASENIKKFCMSSKYVDSHSIFFCTG